MREGDPGLARPLVLRSGGGHKEPEESGTHPDVLEGRLELGRADGADDDASARRMLPCLLYTSALPTIYSV